MDILDTSKVHELIDLIDIQQVLNTLLSSPLIKIDIDLIGKLDNLRNQKGDLFILNIDGSKFYNSIRFKGHIHASIL